MTDLSEPRVPGGGVGKKVTLGGEKDSSGKDVGSLIQSENPADVKERHNRYSTVAITSTHPGDDTTAMTFTQGENVRRYRVFPVGTDGDLLKIVEDAVNGVQELAWVSDETSSLTAVKEWWAAEVNKCSEWKELTRGSNDLSLSRLGFEVYASGSNVTALIVEAE